MALSIFMSHWLGRNKSESCKCCFQMCLKSQKREALNFQPVLCITESFAHLISMRAAAMKKRPTCLISDFIYWSPRMKDLLRAGMGKSRHSRRRSFVNWLVLLYNFIMHHFRKGWYRWRVISYRFNSLCSLLGLPSEAARSWSESYSCEVCFSQKERSGTGP